ncbi:MAG TPA: ATP phosphoribosyltransferase regulatory subunit [Patescibacteria group bacterium]
MQKAPPTPKGFRDILPDLAKKRRQTINQIADILEEFEFIPIETPTIEFAQTLTGKYGEEEKLIYKFQDRGGRDLALRYDLTVPLARFIANNQQLIANGPFRRYQIGQVFRGENPQHGRYREFTQFDFDTVGSNRLGEDAKIISAAIKAAKKLGLKDAKMFINHKSNFEQVPLEVVRAIDKFYKIGMDGIKKELFKKNFTEEQIQKFIEQIALKLRINVDSPSADLHRLNLFLKEEHKLEIGTDYDWDENLARGIDYYTGAIFELKAGGKAEELTIGAGGRYDNLIGMFVHPDRGRTKKDIPAVGFSFGIDRLIEAIDDTK